MTDQISNSSEILPPKTKPQQALIDSTNTNRQHSNQENIFSDTTKESELQERQRRYKIVGAINTDYESSAVEDNDLSSQHSTKYKNAEFALLSYSRTNKLEKLQALLNAKFRNEITLDLNFRGQQKQNFSWSALHLACYFGHTSVVEQLLSNETFREEIDINIQNNSGDTPLHKATLTNRAHIVQLLISYGANVFIKNCDNLLAKQLTSDKHILNMLEASEETDRMRIRKEVFKAVDNGDLNRVQEHFNYYNSQSLPVRQKDQSDENLEHHVETGQTNTTSRSNNDHEHSRDTLNQMTDERGNTLLHLAAMRGFKAICIFLLEQGLDPYKKNNLGQNCMDLSSHQLSQLFKTVKPTNNHLSKLSRQMVTRFEGPLLKKVRILGWRQIYGVLENGVILLFNNRVDSMNKSRRGYKYLESATCEPDLNDFGTFTLCFSDKSKAIFTITAEHLNSYPSFKSTVDKSPGQIELIRQKWIDSIRDHIKYSTEFIRNGLKFNDDDEKGFQEAGDLTTVNYLLPMDTIKSFIQEARAHYSILERHGESLCNLVQSINSSSHATTSLELSGRVDDENNPTYSSDIPTDTNMSAEASSNSSGNRLFGLIRSSRNNRNVSNSVEAGITSSQSVALTSASLQQKRMRNNGLTNEFMQDNWHCLLFHLHLLVESTQNTSASMRRALALMEHQEQLRQERIQDQEERCRVLEDSLHALARDHHELEKSISTSQLYHSAAGRSISMSTDLNEYFDAFEDFDDEKTMTPNSMPSDEELDMHIMDVMNEVEGGGMNGGEHRMRGPVMKVYVEAGNIGGPNGCADEDEDEDDLRSNCSALTAETISEHHSRTPASELSTTNNCNKKISGSSKVSTEESRCRTRLPAPMVPRDQVSIWSILKNCIGKELSKITMPVVFNEPLTMLQRSVEGVQYSRFLQMADQSDNPIERMEYICAFVIAGLSANCHRIIKPFNPLLYETYEFDHELEDGSVVRTMAQQVSHHPPITVAYSESDYFIYHGSVNPKIKFWGRSIEVLPDGQCRIYLKSHNETYIFKSVSCSVHNIIVGKLWFEHRGPLDIKCVETNVQANLVFKQAGWFSNDLHRFEGVILTGDEKLPMDKRKVRFVFGKWSDYIKSIDYSSYANYMKENQQKLFKIPDNPDQDPGQSNGLASNFEKLTLTRPASSGSVNNNSIPCSNNNATKGEILASNSIDSDQKFQSNCGDNKRSIRSQPNQILDTLNPKTLWRLESQYLEEYYNFTSFTMRLNELSPGLDVTLPKTDSRFRPDVRKLEEGDLDGAADEKQRLEEKQREARRSDKRFREPCPDLLWFEHKSVPYSNEKFWMYKGDYWESKCNSEKFPNLF